MKIEIISNSPRETRKIGALLAKEVLRGKRKVFIAMTGGLGSGKTTFVKGFIKKIGIEEDVTSPTFLIYKKYQGRRDVYHFDAYRIKDKDLSLLGFEEILKKDYAVIVVEWSENIKKSIPQEKIKISFFVQSPKERKLIVEDNSGIITNSSTTK
jgi:tRNA threonylcarbamoyladenosine biosynthesis protein TsaE